MSEWIPFGARVRVADVADMLIDLGHEETAYRLIDVVRCCEHFPECSHMLAFMEAPSSGEEQT